MAPQGLGVTEQRLWEGDKGPREARAGEATALRPCSPITASLSGPRAKAASLWKAWKARPWCWSCPSSHTCTCDTLVPRDRTRWQTPAPRQGTVTRGRMLSPPRPPSARPLPGPPAPGRLCQMLSQSSALSATVLNTNFLSSLSSFAHPKAWSAWVPCCFQSPASLPNATHLLNERAQPSVTT